MRARARPQASRRLALTWPVGPGIVADPQQPSHPGSGTAARPQELLPPVPEVGRRVAPQVQRLARDYAREALAWLIEDGLAVAVEVGTGIPRRGWLRLRIDIAQQDGRHSTHDYEWEYA